MGQQTSVGAAGGAALDQRGGVRQVGKLVLAVAAGAVVGAGLHVVVDRVVDDGVAVQEAAVAVDGNQEAAAELAREKAALLAAGAGAVEVDSAADAANVLAQEKAALVASGGGVVLDVDSGGDVANALARDKTGLVESGAGVGEVEVPVWVKPYVGEAAEVEVPVWVRPYVGEPGWEAQSLADKAASDRLAGLAEYQDGSAGAAAAEAANQLRRAG